MRFRRALALLVAMSLTSACSLIPEGGRVVSGGEAGEDQSQANPYIRFLPLPPKRDADAADIVEGFLAASASFDDDHVVARQFLAPGVQWKPGSTTVYEGDLRRVSGVTSRDEAEISVRAKMQGEINTDGQYSAETKKLDEAFKLKKVNGQWRIATLPKLLSAGLLLRQDELERAYRTMKLYFPVKDGQHLVPNAVYVPLVASRAPARTLVEALLKGPTSWLEPAVRSAFPQGTRLKSLRIANDVATVDLSGEARDVPSGGARDQAAQLLWTLSRQFRDIDRLALRIDGKPADVPSKDGVIELSDEWNRYNPDGPSVGRSVYLRNRDHRLEALIGDDLQKISGWTATVDLRRPAISYDQNKVAGLNEARTELRVGGLPSTAQPFILRARDGKFTPPSWDWRGNVWTVENHDGESRLWIIRQGSEPSSPEGWEPYSPDGWGLAGFEVQELRIARDGARIAAVVKAGKDSQLRIGRVSGDPSKLEAKQPFLPVNSQLTSVTGLAWRNADELAVLGETSKNPQPIPYMVPVSGDPAYTLGTGAIGDMKSITAAPGVPTLVGLRESSKDKIYQLNEPGLGKGTESWQSAADGTDPAYPG